MKKKSVGLMGMIFGGLFLSLELYLLKGIQLIEKSSGSWYEDVWVYAGQFPINVALLVTVAVILVSALVFFMAKEE